MENATLNQISYIKKLLNMKAVASPGAITSTIPTLTKKTASDLIGILLKLPWKNTPAPVPSVPPAPVKQTPKIGEGYYALTDPLDGVLKFYRVSVPDKGHWVGCTFLAQMASERHMPIRDKNERNRIFELIAKNPEAAMREYGKHIGKCGHCHRALTDADSRARGIGPVCAGIVTRRFEGWGKEKGL
jgi:hypothetical protein